MKIGLDLHGVLDATPEFFKELCEGLILLGHEIHVITGAPRLEAIDFLDKNQIKYTKLFSITDTFLQKKIPHLIVKNKYTFDNTLWNRAKADYCKKEKIDYHFDDTPHYGKHFTGKFIYFRRDK